MPKVQIDSNTIYNYEVRGEGEPILFIHGSGVNWKFWEPQIPVFSKKFKMIMVDFRGHGESTKEFPGGKYNHFLIAEDLKLFLDAIGESKVHVIGVSQGAQLGTILSCNHPEYIRKLVAVNSYSEFPSLASEWVLKLSNFIFSLLPMKVIFNLMMNVYKGEPYTQEILRKTLSIDKKMLIAMKTAPFPTHTHLLPQITAPTLVMSGAGKVVTGIDEGAGATTIFNNLTCGSTLALFKDAFDPLNTMRKDIFNEMVLDFLEGKKLKMYEGVAYTCKKSAFNPITVVK